MNAQEIRDLFKRHEIDISRNDVWDVQGNLVIRHKALERLAAALRVVWQEPKILRSEREEAVVLVSGHCGKGLEWSIGEALLAGEHANYRATSKTGKKMPAYVWAMAEKRGKDRVILKLAGLHGAYSEEEADDFKQGAKPEEEPSTFGVTKGFDTDVSPQQFGAVSGAVPPTKDSRSVYVENSLNLIEQIQTPEAVSAWLDREVEKGVWRQYGITEHQDDGKAILMACKKRRLELRNAA